MEASINPGDISGGHVKIGQESHLGRNVGIVVGVLVLGAAFVGFQMQSSKQDAANLAALDTFRSLYAEKCDVEEARGTAPQIVREAYLRSENLRNTVAKLATSLKVETNCEQVATTLRAADYPVLAIPR